MKRVRNQSGGQPCEPLEHRRMLASQPYTWQNANIGGGGFVDGIFYSPSQQNVIYARTDIGGVYKTTNDGATWQQLLDFVPNTTGQMMGVLSVAIDPRNTNNLYLDTGEYSGSNGWVLSSTNGGASFNTTNLPFYVGGNSTGRGTGERLAVDPNLGSVLFLGSNDHGLYQSSNSAASFTANSAFNSLVGSSVGVTLVMFDPRSGSASVASQTIYVGVNSTSGGTNLYRTLDGGATWAQLPGGPTGLIPMRASLDSDGNLYVTYSNALPPDGSITNGAVWRYNTATAAWASIAPVVPGAVSGDNFGYCGLAVDPQHVGTVVVTSFDRYSHIDLLWRTTNANAATPTWVQLFDPSSAQNSGYGGYNTTRNTSSAPWTAGDGDGIGNWAATVAINPYNSTQIMYGTGQGIWATNNGTSATKLTAANSWYFPDTGIEFTSVLALAAPATGIPLYSAMGDIGGFSHSSLTSSPSAGNNNGGTDNDIDFAQATPSYAAIVGNFTNGGAYTVNSGLAWTHFNSSAGSGGTIAVAANAASLVWAPSGAAPFYSTNNGATWTASTMPAPPSGSVITGGRVISDRVNPNFFYYSTENSSDNNFIVYVSSNGGATFTIASQTGTGNANLVASPFTAGDLWATCYSPLYESTNFGTSFNYKAGNNPFTSETTLAIGKAAPGQSYPALYVWGTIGGVLGLYRSDDRAATWVRINDTAHQWGGYVQAMAADPSTYGRVYLGFNGRGIILGNPTGNLPAGWTGVDIKSPGNPGYATNSVALSTGSSVNQWTVDGGGSGIGSTSDQFNFASEPVTGNYAAVAQLSSLTNNGLGTPSAGVMFRAAVGPTDVFAAVTQTAANQLLFQYRPTNGGPSTSVSLSSIPIGAEYIELIRAGNTFSAYYGTDGVHWTQLGATVSIPNMPATATAGLAVASGYTPQLSSAVFGVVQITAGPTVATAAAVASSNSTSANLTVLGSDPNGESTLTYTWATTSAPAGAPAPTFTANSTNAAKATTVRVYGAGSYTFTVTATDGTNQSATSTVNFTVATVVGPVTVSPANTTLAAGATQTFTATATDQFGNGVTGFTFTATGGTINPTTGAFTAGATGGTFTVTATLGAATGTTAVTVVPTTYTAGTYVVDIDPATPGFLRVFVNTPQTGQPTYRIALNQIPSLTFTSATLTVDFSNGSPVPTAALSFDGGTTGALTIIGAASNDTAVIDAARVTFDGSTITYANAASVTLNTGAGDDSLTQIAQPSAPVIFNGGTGNDTLSINGGSYTFTTDPALSTAHLSVTDNAAIAFAAGAPTTGFNPYHLAALTVGPAATAVVSTSDVSADRTVLVVTTLTIAPTGQLDLQDNDLVTSTDSTTISTLIAAGSQNLWTGPGLTSSTAAADSTHLTALGTAPNGVPGAPMLPTLDGQPLTGGETLVRYTLIGDANLDGKVDGSDYAVTDNGLLTAATSWSAGDFNYDGLVDGSDYTLIDNAFNRQTTALPAARVATPPALPVDYTRRAAKVFDFSDKPIASQILDQPRERRSRRDM